MDELSRFEWKEGDPPRYVLIADQIRDCIKQGKFALGAPLPSEKDLKELYGFSRYTIREACKLLEKEKYIRKQQGVGMFVADRLPPAAST